MTPELSALAGAIRRRILALTPSDTPSHLTSALSLVDILAALYGDFLNTAAIRCGANDRDRVVLSKGHGALALYATLAECGVIPPASINDYGPEAQHATIHPQSGRLAGIEATAGSLGHGVALGAGMALAHLLRGLNAHTVVIVGDGELQEGSIWEAALFAANHRLEHLVVVVDRNGLQQTGRVAAIGNLEPLGEKWQAFGWHVEQLAGHQPAAIAAALRRSREPKRPLVVIAETIKGHGVEPLEDLPGLHFAAPGAALLRETSVDA